MGQVWKNKHERAVTECEGERMSTRTGALSEADMARRSFFGRIGRWSAGLALLGFGAETWVQAVSRRSIISSALAAGAPRDPRLHPFPSDDPFNMPLGVNAWYAPYDDPATYQARFGMTMAVNNGWSFEVYYPTQEDPVHSFNTDPSDPSEARKVVESYMPDEDGLKVMYEHLQLDATEAGFDLSTYSDGVLLITIGNDLVETFRFRRYHPDYPELTDTINRRMVRNRADHYCHRRTNDRPGRAGVRAAGYSAFAGLIRRHEVERDTPHIPHALAIATRKDRQSGQDGDGDPSSPLYEIPYLFPANNYDFGGSRWGPYSGNGNLRMGMRFGLDPSVFTDEYIEANAPNRYQKAVARALRDYGMITGDSTGSYNKMYCEPGVSSEIDKALRDLSWLTGYMRRVAGAGPVHNPGSKEWDTWRAMGEGWGGGAPRVPYSPPLSSAVPPQSPGSINVTEGRRFGDTA